MLNLLLCWLIVWFIGFQLSLLIFKEMKRIFRLITSFALGFGLISCLVSILGLIYNFGFPALLTSTLFIILFLSLLNRNKLKAKFKIYRIDLRLAWIIIPFIFTSFLHIFLFPELYNDSMIYGYWAKILYQRKNISFLEGGPTIALGFASNYPSAYQLIGAFIYSFTGEDLTHLRLTSLLVTFLLILFIHHWSKEIFKEERASFYSTLLFISLPLIIFFSRSASQYIYLTFQFSLACYFLHKYQIGKGKNDLYLASTFAGFAALTSYLGLTYLIFLPLLVSRKNLKEILFSFLIFSFIISPWYLRNLIFLGSPFYPFFGTRYIDPLIKAKALEQLNKVSKISGFNYESVENLVLSLKRLFFSFWDYRDAGVYHGLNPIFTFLAIPALFIWLRKREEKLKFFVHWFLMILFFYILLANYWNKYLIVISVPTVILATNLITKLNTKIAGLILVALFANSLFLSFFWDDCPSKNLFETLDKLGDKKLILEICYGNDAKLWNWVNENLPTNVTLATNDFRLYYYNRTILELNSWKLRGLQYSKTVEESVSLLKENNISHVVLIEGIEELKIYPEYFKLVKEFDGKAIFIIKM